MRHLVRRVLFVAEEREDRRVPAALRIVFPSVLVAAAIAGKLGDDVIPPPAPGASAQDGVALGLQLRKGGLRRLHLPVKLHAARRAAQRAPEQEHIVVAVGALGVGLRPMEIGVRLPHVLFDARKLILSGIRRAAIELGLKLPAASARSAVGLLGRRSAIGRLLRLRLSPARRIVAATVAPSPALGGGLVRPGGGERQSANDAETAKESLHVNPPPPAAAPAACP